MSLLTVVQDACNELQLVAPSTVIGNTDQQVVQLLALSNREGKEMAANAGQWSGMPELRKEYTFNLVPATGGNAGVYVGNTTNNSNVITGIASTSGILQGYGVSGGSILTGAIVQNVTATTVTLNTPANANATAQNFSFGQIAYNLPSDIAFFMTQTEWDRNFRWQLLGPISGQEWQTIVSGISPVGPRIRFRIMAGQFYIQPPPGPTQTDTIVFEYLTKNWCMPVGTTTPTLDRWAADTDVYAFPEDILVLGIKWRFLRAKGLDYGDEYQQWERARDRWLARSGGNRTLPLNAQSFGPRLISDLNAPDTGFGT